MPAETKRWIILTGVTRGLGRAMAAEFIRRGHTVCGCGRDSAAVAKLRAEFGAPHDFAMVDVASDTAVRAWATALLPSRGAPDLLVNNAAIINPNAPLWKIAAEDFDRLMQVNVCGTANVIRHFAPAMIARKRGVIVNFSSGWGRSTSAEVAPYCASKWAIEGLTQALSQELPAGMAAVPLNPGIIDTQMLRSCFGSGAASFPAPAEWAKRAVPFILGLDARHNGQPLSVS
jgi:NAD(P)-dependent dehydrogenase (short-subunit alcohol dehydrogenase family)